MKALIAAAAIVAIAGAFACKSSDEGAEGPHEPDAVYTVRGVVKALPRTGESEMMVMHEAIDDFKDRDGNVVGMVPMVMPFRLQPGVSAEGLEVADKVSMKVEVHWHAKTALEIASIEKLPPDTQLDLGTDQP